MEFLIGAVQFISVKLHALAAPHHGHFEKFPIQPHLRHNIMSQEKRSYFKRKFYLFQKEKLYFMRNLHFHIL